MSSTLGTLKAPRGGAGGRQLVVVAATCVRNRSEWPTWLAASALEGDLGGYAGRRPMTTDTSHDLRDAYLDLLARALLGLTVEPLTLHRPIDRGTGRVRSWVIQALRRRGGPVLARPVTYDLAANTDGSMSVWALPPWPVTMVGETRLQNVRRCIEDVVREGVPGDLIETGVWKGGTTIFMRGVLRAHGDRERMVYVADSFEGLPPPDPSSYPADEGLDLHLWPDLAVGLEAVKANFERFGLLDDRVQFVKGWFKDTLPGLREQTWSVLRLDGDLYESTMNALENLYPQLSPGGWVIVDDHEIPACAAAVRDYRGQHGIDDPIETIDWTGVCWRKRRA